MDKKKLVSQIISALLEREKEIVEGGYIHPSLYLDQMVRGICIPLTIIVDVERLDGGYVEGFQYALVVEDDEWNGGTELFSCKDREIFAGRVARYLRRNREKLAAETARLRKLAERRVAELEAERPDEEWGDLDD